MVRRQTWQARRFEIFESARHFQIESGRPIRIRIESRSFAGPYKKLQIAFVDIFLLVIRARLHTTERFFDRNSSAYSDMQRATVQ